MGTLGAMSLPASHTPSRTVSAKPPEHTTGSEQIHRRCSWGEDSKMKQDTRSQGCEDRRLGFLQNAVWWAKNAELDRLRPSQKEYLPRTRQNIDQQTHKCWNAVHGTLQGRRTHWGGRRRHATRQAKCTFQLHCLAGAVLRDTRAGHDQV